MPEKLEYRVEQLESKIGDACADIKLILTNHLPHIEQSFPEYEIKITEKISAKIDKAFRWFIVALSADCTIIGLMIKFIQ